VDNEFLPFSQLIYSVSDLTAYIRAVLESNENLANIWVSGEISNLARPGSGHVYFTLKDVNASLRCVIWREQARYLSSALHDGMAVEAHGSVSVYEQGGQYQLYVDGLRAAGEGLLYQEFLRLKTQLEAEGIFDEERKRPIPRLPRVIGIVTSPTGAALQDMLNTLRARCPMVEVVLSPAAVQGDAAPPQIAAALQALNEYIKPDVIIVGRGGGSLEDLWAFNDEIVVRAVAASEAPVISGVGHETDFTLVDFAADLRAPTPTGAAVMAVPDRLDLVAELQSIKLRLTQDVQSFIESGRYEIRDLSHRLDQVSPRWRVMQDIQRLDELSLRFVSLMKNNLRSQTARLQALQARLKSLDPRQVLNRGYALVRNSSGSLITSLQQVKLDKDVEVRIKDGRFGAHVTEIKDEK
jgi:exodeoxyribonuclease VII large subunit